MIAFKNALVKRHVNQARDRRDLIDISNKENGNLTLIPTYNWPTN